MEFGPPEQNDSFGNQILGHHAPLKSFPSTTSVSPSQVLPRNLQEFLTQSWQPDPIPVGNVLGRHYQRRGNTKDFFVSSCLLL